LSDKPGQKDEDCGLGFDGMSWWELSYSSSPTTATDPEFFYTSPDAGSYLPDGGGVDYTSPDAGSYLPARQTQAVQR